jgi:rubrerythrin
MPMLDEIFQTALEFERRGREYYLQAARRVRDVAIKAVLQALAHDEELHESVIRRYYQALQRTEGWPELDEELPRPTPARQRVEQIVAETAGSISADASYAGVYEQARELELRSRDFYRQQAEAVEDGAAVKFFRFLAGMEQTHLEMLGLLLEATRAAEEDRQGAPG